MPGFGPDRVNFHADGLASRAYTLRCDPADHRSADDPLRTQAGNVAEHLIHIGLANRKGAQSATGLSL